jgi:hypothetical protein
METPRCRPGRDGMPVVVRLFPDWCGRQDQQARGIHNPVGKTELGEHGAVNRIVEDDERTDVHQSCERSGRNLGPQWSQEAHTQQYPQNGQRRQQLLRTCAVLLGVLLGRTDECGPGVQINEGEHNLWRASVHPRVAMCRVAA